MCEKPITEEFTIVSQFKRFLNIKEITFNFELVPILAKIRYDCAQDSADDHNEHIQKEEST